MHGFRSFCKTTDVLKVGGHARKSYQGIEESAARRFWICRHVLSCLLLKPTTTKARSAEQVAQNTVTDCPYDFNLAPPSAIYVYAGSDNINATNPVQNGVEITGNLVNRGLVRPHRMLHIQQMCS